MPLGFRARLETQIAGAKCVSLTTVTKRERVKKPEIAQTKSKTKARATTVGLQLNRRMVCVCVCV